MELDDETVAAIATELVWGAHKFRLINDGDIRRLAAIYAKHLPDPRPTEAAVRESLSIDYWHDSSFRRVLRDLGCFRPEPEPDD
jgi:hypothetical protein